MIALLVVVSFMVLIVAFCALVCLHAWTRGWLVGWLVVPRAARRLFVRERAWFGWWRAPCLVGAGWLFAYPWQAVGRVPRFALT